MLGGFPNLRVKQVPGVLLAVAWQPLHKEALEGSGKAIGAFFKALPRLFSRAAPPVLEHAEPALAKAAPSLIEHAAPAVEKAAPSLFARSLAATGRGAKAVPTAAWRGAKAAPGAAWRGAKATPALAWQGAKSFVRPAEEGATHPLRMNAWSHARQLPMMAGGAALGSLSGDELLGGEGTVDTGGVIPGINMPLRINVPSAMIGAGLGHKGIRGTRLGQTLYPPVMQSAW